MTEIHHFLRLLYVKLGTQMCPNCNVPVEPQKPEQIVAQILRDYKGRHIGVVAPLVTARKGYYTDLAKWAAGKGFSHLRVDGAFIPVSPWPRLDRYREHTIELPIADLIVDAGDEASLREAVRSALEHGQGTMTLLIDLTDGSSVPLQARREAGLVDAASERQFSVKRACPGCGMSFPEPDPRMFSYNSKHGWCISCFGTGLQLSGFDEQQTGEESTWNAWYEGSTEVCRTCHGERLNPISRAFRWRDRSIAEFAAMPVSEAQSFFTGLVKPRPRGRDCARHSGRDSRAPELHAGSRARVSGAGSRGAHTVGRPRSAAHPAWQPNWVPTCRVSVMCWMSPPSACMHATTRFCSTRCRRSKATANTLVVVEHERRHHTARLPHHRHRARRGRARRHGSGARHGPRGDGQPGLCHRPLSAPAAGPPDAAAARHRSRRTHDHCTRRPPAQLAQCRGPHTGGPAECHYRRVRLGQVHARARRPARQPRARAVSTRQAPAWQGCTSIEGWEQIDRVLEVDQTPSARRPAPAPPPMSASGTTCASCSRARAKPGCAAGSRRGFPSTQGMAAALFAKARACAPSK